MGLPLIFCRRLAIYSGERYEVVDKDKASMTNAREKARQLAQDYIAQNKPLDWFEVFYTLADGDEGQIAWADMAPNPNLTEWVARQQVTGAGKRALVVGCGLGDDAEYLAQRGFLVTAFDIAPTAVNWCKKRFPSSPVQYLEGNALEVPEAWHGQFEVIFEAYTLQVLPAELRSQAMKQIAVCLAPDGVLLVVARGREPEEDKGNLPWPLTRDELGELQKAGLREILFEDYMDGDTRRFRVEYQK
jgi:2-polyprenyl-3-methyl-5-hydroxy-6-metoxy-1,4-benzoquinol methylase